MRLALIALLLLAQEPPAEKKVEGWKKTFLDTGAARKDREEAAAKLAQDKDGGHFLLGLASQEKLPKEFKVAVGGAIFRNPDLGIRGLASQYFKRPAKAGEVFPAIADLAKMKGDPEKGKKLFFDDKVACSKCHKYGDEGSDVGPPLTEIRGKLARTELLDAILNPSAVLSFGYESWVLVTTDDQVYSGIILAEGDEVLFKEASGEERTVPTAKIKHRKKLDSSLMPDNIALGLKPQELVDLVDFLLQEPK